MPKKKQWNAGSSPSQAQATEQASSLALSPALCKFSDISGMPNDIYVVRGMVIAVKTNQHGITVLMTPAGDINVAGSKDEALAALGLAQASDPIPAPPPPPPMEPVSEREPAYDPLKFEQEN